MDGGIARHGARRCEIPRRTRNTGAGNARLRSENAELKNELAQYIEQWETLDGDAVRTLQYLAQGAYASADAIARTHNMNSQIAEMYLQFLVTHAYVHPPAPDGKAGYGLSHKGRRYLHSRGLAT